jgi:hypothetical protein
VASVVLTSPLLRVLLYIVFLIGFGILMDWVHPVGWLAVVPFVVIGCAVVAFVGVEVRYKRSQG